MKLLLVFAVLGKKKRVEQEQLLSEALGVVDDVLGFKAPIRPVVHVISAGSLGGLVVDWEAADTVLDEEVRRRCQLFDSFDMVFIFTSLKQVLPWDEKLAPLLKLINMCHATQKPCFTSGFAAWAEVHVAATRGKRVALINGPLGGKLEDLPTFSTYSPQQPLPAHTRGFPKPSLNGWLDSETGDVYEFDVAADLWRPVLNIGLRRIAASGEPTSPRFVPRDRSYVAEQRNAKNVPEAIVCDGEALVHIDPRLAQHPAVAGLPPQFLLRVLPEWHINRAGHLPAACHVVGESKTGPILIVHGNTTICAAEVGGGKHRATGLAILKSFIRHVARLMHQPAALKRQNRIGSLLTNFLFGSEIHPAFFAKTTSLQEAFKPIAEKAVRSILHGGPQPTHSSQPAAAAAGQHIALTAAPARNAHAHAIIKSPLAQREVRRSLLLGAVGLSSDQDSALAATAARDVDAEEAAAAAARASALLTSTPPSKSKHAVSSVPSISGWSTLASAGPETPSSGAVVSLSGSLSERLHRERARLYLPQHHPASLTSRGDCDDGPGIFSPVKPTKPTNSSKPYNTFRKIKCAAAAADASEEKKYEGQYKDGPYQSPWSKEIKARALDKEKYKDLHGGKGFHLGSPRHVLPLREPGAIRAQGPYPEMPRSQGFEHMTAADAGILRSDNREKWIRGHWKRS